MPDPTDTPGQIARRRAVAYAETLDWERRHRRASATCIRRNRPVPSTQGSRS